MNYCCATGSCWQCIERYERRARLAAQRATYYRPKGPTLYVQAFDTVDVRIIDEEQYNRMWYVHPRQP